MRVLIVGVSGFIGSALAARLSARGDEVVGVSRSRPPTDLPLRHIALDVATAVSPGDWRQHLAGIDAVVYCAGALQDSRSDSLEAVHHQAPSALFAACVAAGVRRVVHLSAIGVDRAAPTAFSRTKRKGDHALAGLDLDWVILRPSVVVGRTAYGGSALLRGLAALPVLPLPRDAGRLQVVHLDDLMQTILFFLEPKAPAKIALDIVGPRAWSLEDLVGLFRRWLGGRPAVVVHLPAWLGVLAFRLGDLAGWFGWRSAVRSTAGHELLRGAEGDPEPWMAATGIQPRDIDAALRREAATVQEKWFARLYLLRPWIFGIAALFWISTGLIALGPGWQNGVALMNEGGVRGWPAAATVVAGALCDIAVGLAIAWRRTARAGVTAAFVITLVYAVLGTILVPSLWIDPMGPMLKAIPILVLHLAALGIIEDR
ncbi:MAG: SDR family oxidoreductase [Reyranella sp.]|uniref:SDR family oxidoreductase n=1 Tax=Reyranella sp. TaxID=1929291 RepID=UPI003D0F43BE